MKNFENTALLAHKRRVDAALKAAWVAKQKQANLAAIRKVGGAK